MNYVASRSHPYSQLRKHLRYRPCRPARAVLHLELHATEPQRSENLPIAAVARAERH